MPRHQHRTAQRLLEDALRFYTLREDAIARAYLKRASYSPGPSSEAPIRAEALYYTALLDIQGRQTELAEHALWHMGFRYMLPAFAFPLEESCNSVRESNEICFAKMQDDVLPPSWCDRLLRCVGFGGSFWREFGATCPETAALPPFSFAVPLQLPADNGMADLLKVMQAQVARDFPEVAKAQTAEIWWHCRGLHDIVGHPLHFDWDPYPPHARHSLVTSILYLTDSGAPTVCLDETCDSDSAAFGVLAFPRVARALHYQSDRLHGVLPSLALPRDSLGSGHRITFMVAWWLEDLEPQLGMRVEPLMRLGGSWLSDLGRFTDPMTSPSHLQCLPTIPGWRAISEQTLQERLPPDLRNIAPECSFHSNFFLSALRQPGTKWF